jgi:hypothetical protein
LAFIAAASVGISLRNKQPSTLTPPAKILFDAGEAVTLLKQALVIVAASVNIYLRNMSSRSRYIV